MEEAFVELLSINYVSFFFSFFKIIAALTIIKLGLEKFADTYGFQVPWKKWKKKQEQFFEDTKRLYEQLELREKNLEKRHKDDIEQVKEIESEICKSLTVLQSDLSDFMCSVKDNELKKKIKKLRWDIINFASTISEKKIIPIEQYNIVFSDIQEYEEIIEKYNLVNGQVNSSVVVIKDRYEQDLRSGLLS